MKFFKIFFSIFLIFPLSLLGLLSAVDVYFLNKTLEIGKPNILIINATDYNGKMKGILNFGNYIVKIECVFLNNNILRYKIIPSDTKGFVFLELDDGTIINKQFEIKNTTKREKVFRIFYVREKYCEFTPKKNKKDEEKNKSINLPLKNKTFEKENEEKNKKNFNIFLIVLSILGGLILFLFYYFYRLGRIEEKLSQKIKIEIKKVPKEIEIIENEKDYKKKAYLFYNYLKKLSSSKNNLKIKEMMDKLYFYSFKKELNEKEKEEIDKFLMKIKGDLNE